MSIENSLKQFILYIINYTFISHIHNLKHNDAKLVILPLKSRRLFCL